MASRYLCSNDQCGKVLTQRFEQESDPGRYCDRCGSDVVFEAGVLRRITRTARNTATLSLAALALGVALGGTGDDHSHGHNALITFLSPLTLRFIDDTTTQGISTAGGNATCYIPFYLAGVYGIQALERLVQ